MTVSTPSLVAWFETIGGTVIPLTDSSVDLANWFKDHQVHWALQRPDFALFGTATDADGAAGLLTDSSWPTQATAI